MDGLSWHRLEPGTEMACGAVEQVAQLCRVFLNRLIVLAFLLFSYHGTELRTLVTMSFGYSYVLHLLTLGIDGLEAFISSLLID